jgi:hypothetical protein
MYGIPKALLSPKRFIESVISFGGRSRLFYFSPVFVILLTLALLKITAISDLPGKLKNNRALTFNLFWIVSGFALLMIFNYRPLRYQLFLLLPIAGLFAMTFVESDKTKTRFKIFSVRSFFVFLVCWYCLAQLFILTAAYLPDLEPNFKYVWYSFAPAIVVFLLITLKHKPAFSFLKGNRNVLIFLTVFSIIVQSLWIYKWFDKRSNDLSENGNDLAQILGIDAVLIGPYSNALAINSNLKTIIYMFGLSKNEPDLFKRFPVTHLATDITNWEAALKAYPWLKKNTSFTTSYWIRDIEISIIRILPNPDFTNNSDYQMSNYEKAMQLFTKKGDQDSLMYYLTIFLNRNPENKSGLKLLASVYEFTDNYSKCFDVHDKLINLYPDDFTRYYDKALLYYRLYLSGNNTTFKTKADEYFSMAREINPYIDEDIKIAKKAIQAKQ